MHLRRILLSASMISPLALSTPGTVAGEHHHAHQHRQHGAHVHGMAALNLALEGEEAHLELHSPAANIVGFEHVPASEADRDTLDEAISLLKDGDRLFRFNDAAGCRMEKAQINSSLLDEEDREHEHHEEDDHGHDEHDEHGHEGREDETHSDIEAAFHFECDAPGELTHLDVELFVAFPGMHKLNLQYVIESRQGAAELTPDNHVIEF